MSSTVGNLVIRPGCVLAADDLRFRLSRSSGPGGQNVQKVETRVEVLLELDTCRAFDEGQRARIREALASRVSKLGVLRVVSQAGRTQGENRQRAVERLVELLQWALTEPDQRTATKVPRRERSRRLVSKKRRGTVKATRGRVDREALDS